MTAGAERLAVLEREIELVRAQSALLALLDKVKDGVSVAALNQADLEAQTLRAQFGKVKTELEAILVKAQKGERVEFDLEFLIGLCPDVKHHA